jgi:hypothetical protein
MVKEFGRDSFARDVPREGCGGRSLNLSFSGGISVFLRGWGKVPGEIGEVFVTNLAKKRCHVPRVAPEFSIRAATVRERPRY